MSKSTREKIQEELGKRILEEIKKPGAPAAVIQAAIRYLDHTAPEHKTKADAEEEARAKRAAERMKAHGMLPTEPDVSPTEGETGL